MRRIWTVGAALVATMTATSGASAQDRNSVREDLARLRVASRVAEVQVRSDRAIARSELRAREAQLALRSRSAHSEVRSDLARVRAELRAAEAARAAGAARLYPSIEDAAIPEAWLPQDPADSLYRAARSRLNDRRYAEAARLFAEIRGDYPRSGYVGDAFYFEALARSRVGAQRELRTALELLAVQRREHPGAATAADARALAVRIESQLARNGDARAAESLVGAARGGDAQVACDDDDQAMRATALSALLQMDPERARPILQEVLRSRDECSAELRAPAVLIHAQHLEAVDATLDLLLDLAHRNP
ncbi:MAG: hypothetical protein RLN75_05050, partial [Longimicrobiales bacterium]